MKYYCNMEVCGFTKLSSAKEEENNKFLLHQDEHTQLQMLLAWTIQIAKKVGADPPNPMEGNGGDVAIPLHSYDEHQAMEKSS
jgi:hypothetical protein